MRLALLSDLHLEFHADAGASFVASLDPTAVDVLVLAGDIAVGAGIGPALDAFCRRYREVVYVHGNHEFYGTDRPSVVRETERAAKRNQNLRWLDASTVVLDGVRFLGAPLWFLRPPNVDSIKYAMNDFRVIRDFERWVYDESARAIAFFEQELREGDVVVTHHLPAQACVAQQYRGSALNAFFVCDVEPLLRERRPRLWLHGHTHSSVDVQLGETRVLCNPFGYAPTELNAAFREDLQVQL